MTTRQGISKTEVLFIIIVLVVAVFLVGVFLPSFGRTRKLARAVKCSTQLNGIGKAMALYRNDCDGSMPTPWSNNVRTDAQFGMGLYNYPGENLYTRWMNPNFNDWDNEPTVGGCLWLLIKYEDLVPNMFLCPQDENGCEIVLADAIDNYPDIENWADLNDFSNLTYLSFAYNDPWAAPLNTSSPPEAVVMADKSNAYATTTRVPNPQAGNQPVPNPDGSWTDAEGKNPRAGNSPNHKFQNQSVLYMDNHVKKLETPLTGVDADNIYTRWDTTNPTPPDKRIGRWDRGHAQDVSDSYLGN